MSLERVTSGPVGCPASDIEITSKDTDWVGNARTWTAECHGKTYYCSAQGGGGNAAPVAVCNPATNEGSKSQPAAGCQYDTQCKGDRICRAGACVEP